MLPTESSNLYWEVSTDGSELQLEFFTGFKGSSSGANCAGVCTCLLNFSEI